MRTRKQWLRRKRRKGINIPGKAAGKAIMRGLLRTQDETPSGKASTDADIVRPGSRTLNSFWN